MKKNKKRRLSLFARVLICIILLVATGYLMFSGLQDLKTTAEIKMSIQENEKKSEDLDETKKELEDTKQKLTNPDYVEHLARGKYLVTKEGEQVFKFPSKDEQKEAEKE